MIYKRENLNIKAGHKLVKTKMENKVKKSEDYDLCYYDEIDANKKLVAKYIVRYSVPYNSTSIYLPFSVYIEYQRFDIDGNQLRKKRV